ncbi:MAG: GNAT family acetyltransferase [Lachnospiraceae bacterium]|nr:GNAT family acetyltransferase [Lachnospiraceae bacterium]
MIQRKDLLAFDFYKKEKFTGSYKGMRYLIQKAAIDETAVFLVTTWSGPYSYANTDASLRTEKSFPFEAASLEEITDYLNQTYQEKKGEWPTRIS